MPGPSHTVFHQENAPEPVCRPIRRKQFSVDFFPPQWLLGVSSRQKLTSRKALFHQPELSHRPHCCRGKPRLAAQGLLPRWGRRPGGRLEMRNLSVFGAHGSRIQGFPFVVIIKCVRVYSWFTGGGEGAGFVFHSLCRSCLLTVSPGSQKSTFFMASEKMEAVSAILFPQ